MSVILFPELVVWTSATVSQNLSDNLVLADDGPAVLDTIVVLVPTPVSESEQYSKKNGRPRCNAFCYSHFDKIFRGIVLYCNIVLYITFCSCATESQAYESIAPELVVQASATDSQNLSDTLVMAGGVRAVLDTIVVSVPTSMSESELYSKKNGRSSCNTFYYSYFDVIFRKIVHLYNECYIVSI